MKKYLSIITIAVVLSSTIKTQAQSLNQTSSISLPGSANTFNAGYTFSYTGSGTPWNGSLISYGGFSNNYDTQISSDYGANGGNHISYRTRNGDTNTWNSWNELATRGTNSFIGDQNISGKLVVNSNIGIGTNNPLGKLEINGGNLLVRNFSNTDNVSSIMIGHSINEGALINFGTSIGTIVQSAGNNTYGMQFFTMESYQTGQTEKVRIQGNGNVGIGTTNPDEKLTVKGKIHTQEVRVDMNGPLVPDYVFANDYKLKTLKEVEDYVRENSHLPEIPSAKEIERNGLMLAEMNMSLLKKIEELTLYSIEQEKKLQSQNNKIIVLEKQNEKLLEIEKRLEKLEGK